ncbi:MAG: cytochrome c-type biosis protein [Clostridia bacterium]|nr:cytochrome c-type biosis protein [Clostridia bacterium]
MTGEMIGVGAAFLAGLLSFFSPCVLPLIPAYLAHLSGSTPAELKNRDRETFYRVIKNAAGFVLGLSVTFILLGLTSQCTGKISPAVSRSDYEGRGSNSYHFWTAINGNSKF